MRAARSIRVAAFLALRSLVRGNWGILTMTVAMMVLVYLNLLFLPSLIDGASQHLLSRLIETTTANLQITAANQKTGISEPDAYEAKIAEQPGVSAVTSVKLLGNRIFYGSNAGSWSVDAIKPSSYDHVFTTHKHLIEGHWLASTEADGIVLGAAIAGTERRKPSKFKNSLEGVHVGDAVSVALANGRTHSFVVRGIFDDEFKVADNRAYITEQAARMLDPASAKTVDAIFVKTSPRAKLGQVRSKIEPLKSSMKIETSGELEEPIEEQTASYKLIGDVMKLISALVAAITIFIVTYVDLVNRRKQIGIERAIGIRRSAILASYCLKALAYALSGALIGALIFRGAIVPIIAAHPFHFPSGHVALSPTRSEMVHGALLLLIVAVIAAFLPAYRTLRMKILDAIWG